MSRSAPASSRAALSGLTRKIVIATLIGVAVFAALSIHSDVTQLTLSLRAFEWSAFAFALLLSLVNYALRFARFQYYLRCIDVRVPTLESALVFLAGFVMGVTPGKLGEVLKSLLLFERRNIPIAKTAPVVIAERLTDLLALVVLTALGSLSFPLGAPVALASAAIVGTITLACAYRPFAQLLIGLAAKLPVLGKIAPKLSEAYESLAAMMRPTALMGGTLLAVFSWGLECVGLYVIAHGFADVTLGWQAAAFAYSASTLAGALAMMPGGLGVTEVGMTSLLTEVGGPGMLAATATATTILVRLATLWFAVFLGGLVLPLLRWLPSESHAATAPADG